MNRFCDFNLNYLTIKRKSDRDIVKAEANIDYELDDSGHGVAQLHIMGIEEDKIEALRKVSREAVANRVNYKKLKMLLKGAIGEQGCHIDIRLVRKGDNYFEGGEIMLGNFSGLDKLEGFLAGTKKLRFGWKTPHAEEMEVGTIRGPTTWMKVGSRSIEIFEPGAVGALAKTYAAMLVIDTFDWKLIQADRHAKKLEINNSELFGDCVLLIGYVPVKIGGRVWMISKLKLEKLERELTLIKGNAAQQIVFGIVYEPDEVDAQGDTTTANEIEKACYYFMENSQTFKVSHRGEPVKVQVLENYIAPVDFVVGGRPVKKGSWLLTVRVLDKVVWNRIESGDLQGYSLAGYALGEKL